MTWCNGWLKYPCFESIKINLSLRSALFLSRPFLLAGNFNIAECFLFFSRCFNIVFSKKWSFGHFESLSLRCDVPPKPFYQKKPQTFDATRLPEPRIALTASRLFAAVVLVAKAPLAGDLTVMFELQTNIWANKNCKNNCKHICHIVIWDIVDDCRVFLFSQKQLGICGNVNMPQIRKGGSCARRTSSLP